MGTRWAATVLGLALIGGGIATGAGPYEDRRAYEKASLCGAAPAGDCITQMRLTVLSKSSYTTQDPEPNWPPPQVPPPPPPQPPLGPFRIAPVLVAPALLASLPTGRVLAALPMSQTTHYKLKVRTEDGETHTYTVGPEIYTAAKPGTTGMADLWHGHITRIRIGTHSHEEWSYWWLGVAWLMCWGGVLLIVGWSPLLIPAPVPLMVGALWVGIVALSIINLWHAVVWAVPAILAGVVLALRVFVTVTERRLQSTWYA